jgi:hypothetical protein
LVFFNRDGVGVIIAPEDGQEVVVIQTDDITPADPPLDPPREYKEVGVLMEPDSVTVCTTLCRVPRGAIVRMDPGDTISIPANSVCFVCNAYSEDAVLRVVGPGGLEWSTFTDVATPVASGLHGTRGWFLNPGTSCH